MRQLFHDSPFFARLTFALALVFSATFAHSQVPVGMAPPLHFQFLTANGAPLANGKIFTYSAGTSTPLNTYVDGTGTTQNTNPIVLDATGSPSNGTVQTSIFLANNAYKFVAYNSQNVQQWSVDNVSTYFGLLNSNNVWTGTNTFDNAITILATDQQILLGVPGNQTLLDFPPPTGNVTLEFPNIPDTVVGRTTTDTLTNKTLTSPVINSPTINTCPEPNGVSTCVVLPNSSSGTALFTLVKMTGAGQAVTATTSDTGGVIGVCVAGCGTTGNAVILESGVTDCFFVTTPTPNDYVTISGFAPGNCRDAGSTYPSSGQVIGRVTANSGLLLFGPEIQASVGSGTPSFAPGSGAGSGASASCSGTCSDGEGLVFVNTGTSPSTAATIFTITYGGIHNGSACVFFPNSNNLTTEFSAMTTGGSTPATSYNLVAGGTALSATTNYLITYVCNFR